MKMRVLLAIAALVAVARTASISQEDLEFHGWKMKFGKSYDSEEEESQRKMTWLTNRKLVLEHNMLADQGIKSYRLDMNHFADMDNQEYQARFKSCLVSYNRTKPRGGPLFLQQQADTTLPCAVDWIAAGYVTKVNQQKQCCSCWAFSAAGALEGQLFRKTRQLVSLSEQQLLDCSWLNGNSGCASGAIEHAFQYVEFEGLQSDATYPYEGKDGMCRFNPKNSQATCSGFEELPSGDETILQKAVAVIGPISAAIDTKRNTFRFYSSGVYDEPYCSTSDLDHAVLIVGYGTDKRGQDYWMVKNSWGVQWGEKGYIRMSRNKKNQCGIATRASFPVV
ncbi:procathepsin L isoform X5 [Astyanax mexicanus]|uniref:procathepsin L isoform X5 n=1 Tax=Astyanax mexicanus TaxID=7994 RepID=UPI0020CAC765|nr:procathepsin L isoform X5 [Astyanax mexicanus]